MKAFALLLLLAPLVHAQDNGFMTVDPDDVLYWKFVPNRKGRFKGHPFAVNADGLNDQEHAVAKPAGTVRVAVLGPSAALGYGLDLDDSFHKRLEKLLNAKPADRRPREVLNFSVPGYSLLMLAEQYERKAAKYKPDLVLLCLTDEAFRIDGRHLEESRHWLSRLRRALFPKSENYYSDAYLRRLQSRASRAAGSRQLSENLIKDLKASVSPRRLVVVLLPAAGSEALAQPLAEISRGLGLSFWDLSGLFSGQPGRFQLAAGDDHFDRHGHALIAQRLYRLLAQKSE